jgi:hypothetical protein
MVIAGGVRPRKYIDPISTKRLYTGFMTDFTTLLATAVDYSFGPGLQLLTSILAVED